MLKIAKLLLALAVIAIGVAVVVPWPHPSGKWLVVLLVMLYGVRTLGARIIGKRRSASAKQVQPAPPRQKEREVIVPTPGSDRRSIAVIESFLEDLVARGFSPRGILDVGANRGDWSRMALEIFPDARFLLVEPQTEMKPMLKALSEENPNCSYLIAGVGRESGELVQTIWEDTYGSSFCVRADPALITSGRQRVTPIKTLDQILSVEHPDFSPDLVKLDIQGFELEALRGGSSLFGRSEVIIVETLLLSNNPLWPSLREVVEFMGERGYEIYDITSYLRKPSDGTLGQVDFAFVKDAGVFRRNFEW